MRLTAWLMLPVLLLTGCNWRNQKVPEQVVVKVDERQMTLKEFAEKLARSLKNFDAVVARSPVEIQRAREAVIRDFLLDSLLDAKADQLKISVSEKEWDEEINAIRSGYPDDLSFRKALAEENVALAEWRDLIHHTVLKHKVFQALGKKITKPTDEESRRYFDQNKDRFRLKERVLLRQIVVDDFGKAQDIQGELKKKRDFNDLAKKYSISPERRNGGLVGWVEKGEVEAFDKAFALQIGTLSPIVESPYGFHIFKVEKKEPAGFKKFEEVRNLIDQLVLGQREQKEYTSWLDQELRKSHVWINNDLINQLKVETRIQE
jgi:peptidyl-prolyl cis-trans isomerase C